VTRGSSRESQGVNMETVKVADQLEAEPTVEELELLWWEPLSCKCDIDFEE